MLFLEDFQGIVIVNRLAGIQHTEDSDYHYCMLMVAKIGTSWWNGHSRKELMV